MNTILGPVPLPKMAVYAFHKDSRIREAATLERDHERKRWDKGREDDGGSLALSSFNETIVLPRLCKELASFSL